MLLWVKYLLNSILQMVNSYRYLTENMQELPLLCCWADGSRTQQLATQQSRLKEPDYTQHAADAWFHVESLIFQYTLCWITHSKSSVKAESPDIYNPAICFAFPMFCVSHENKVGYLLCWTFPPCFSSASRSWCRSWTPGSRRGAEKANENITYVLFLI